MVTSYESSLPNVNFGGTSYIPEYHHVLEGLRAEGPVKPVRYGNQIAYMILSHTAILEAIRDPDSFSDVALHEVFTFPVMGPHMNGMEGEDHRRSRALIAPAFRRVAIASYVQSVLEPLCDDLLTGTLEVSGYVDLFGEDFTEIFSVAVISRLLGLPDTDIPKLRHWAIGLLSYFWDPEGAAEAADQFPRHSLLQYWMNGGPIPGRTLFRSS